MAVLLTKHKKNLERNNQKMVSRLFLLSLFVAAVSAARRAPAPSTAPAFWNIEAAASEVVAEAATGAPEFKAPPKATKSVAAAPAPSKQRRRESAAAADSEIDAAGAELDAAAAAAAADVFAQIAAGAQEIEAMTTDAADASAALPELPTFLEIHDDASPQLAAVPAEAVAPHGLVAVGDDAIFAAANSAASAASVAAPSEFSDLEAALDAAAETGNTVVVVDDDAPLSGEQ